MVNGSAMTVFRDSGGKLSGRLSSVMCCHAPVITAVIRLSSTRICYHLSINDTLHDSFMTYHMTPHPGP